MSEIKLYDFQEEVVNCKENMVLNWSRGLGTTFVMAMKILKDKPNAVAYIGCKCDVLGKKFEEIIRLDENFKRDILHFKTNNKYIEIKYRDEKITKIDCMLYFDRNNLKENYSLFVVDDIRKQLPENIEIINKTIDNKIFTTNENNYDKHLQNKFKNFKFIEADYHIGLKNNLYTSIELEKIKNDFYNIWYDEYAILDDKTENMFVDYYLDRYNDFENTINSNNSFLITQLIKLEYECNNIKPSKDNVLTRKNLLDMILSIHRELNGQSVVGVDLQQVSDYVLNKLSDELKKSGIRR